MYNLSIRKCTSPPLLAPRLKIYYPAGDRTPDLLNQRQTCYHLRQCGEHCCTWVYILKFCHFKILSGGMGARKLEWQGEKLEHFRHILLFEFNRGAKVAEVATNIYAVYGDNAIGESTARIWFSRFKDDHFVISDTLRSRRPSGFDNNRLNTLIHNDPRQCTGELANVMNCDRSTIVRHLHSMGKVQKSGVWVLHALSQDHKNQQVAICASLLARQRLAREQHRQFLSCIVNVARNGVFMLT